MTARGAEYHLSGVHEHDNVISIEDIAHALAQINRFTGHANRPYSVAEHSLLCVDIAERLQLSPFGQMAALMHDAHEAYTGDITSPVKWTIGQPWKDFETVHSIAVRKYFGLSTKFITYRQQVEQCDLVALATERRDLMPWRADISSSWPILDTPSHPVPVADWVNLNSLQRVQCHWTEWRDQFLEKFHSLKGASAEWFAANVKEHLS